MSGEKFALITGASLGIGRELARELAKRGHNIALHSLPGEDLASPFTIRIWVPAKQSKKPIPKNTIFT